MLESVILFLCIAFVVSADDCSSSYTTNSDDGLGCHVQAPQDRKCGTIGWNYPNLGNPQKEAFCAFVFSPPVQCYVLSLTGDFNANFTEPLFYDHGSLSLKLSFGSQKRTVSAFVAGPIASVRVSYSGSEIYVSTIDFKIAPVACSELPAGTPKQPQNDAQPQPQNENDDAPTTNEDDGSFDLHVKEPAQSWVLVDDIHIATAQPNVAWWPKAGGEQANDAGQAQQPAEQPEDGGEDDGSYDLHAKAPARSWVLVDDVHVATAVPDVDWWPSNERAHHAADAVSDRARPRQRGHGHVHVHVRGSAVLKITALVSGLVFLALLCVVVRRARRRMRLQRAGVVVRPPPGAPAMPPAYYTVV